VKRKREDALLARVLEGGVRKREREWMVSVVRSSILYCQGFAASCKVWKETKKKGW
jgi:hypothetical protein